jgi:endogenous inhibitor of DNA gyrase (YacG/DUF329 family)
VRKCPTCGSAVEWKDNPWRPFCSERCKLIDFGKWASEEYRMPGQGITAESMPEPKQIDEKDDDGNES